MKSITIRGVNEKLAAVLKKMAIEAGVSINTTILKILGKATNIINTEKFRTYNDLDKLAGGWSKKDEDLFKEKIRGFKNIDKELWK